MVAEHTPNPLLRLKDIHKSFGRVEVLKGISLDLLPGEVHVLAGENGAGKSTLVKILAGIHTEYEGSIVLGNAPVKWAGPSHAARHGISMVHQELSLVPGMSAAENIFLGRELTRGPGWIRRAHEVHHVKNTFQELGLDLDPESPVGEHPVSTQQAVEISKALAFDADVIIMDEPTSALTRPNVLRLYSIIEKLKQQGRSIIYITHRMEEIFHLADRITVLRDGACICTKPAGELDEEALVALMVGRDFQHQFPPRAAAQEDSCLRVSNLLPPQPSLPGRAPVSFTLNKGEIVGIAGLEGSGNHELLLSLFGAFGPLRSAVELHGAPFTIRHPGASIAQGLVLLTSDRKTTGLVQDLGITENISLSSLASFSRFGWLDTTAEKDAAVRHRNEMQIRLSSLTQPVSELSGGNQQKVSLAKCLQARPKVLLLDEPTRGIDVAAKKSIYELMNKWSQAGIGMLLITSELQELLAMSDRILVMHRGNLSGTFTREEATEEKVIRAAMGHVEEAPV